MPNTTHVYEIFIRATPEVVWNALTDPEMTSRYFHATRYESTYSPGAPYRSLLPDDTEAIDGVIEVFEPPRRLVMTWHVLYDAAMAAEPPGRVEWLLASANADGTVTRVTLRHGDLAHSPLTWANVKLGWVGVLDGLKTLLETGSPLGSLDIDSDPPHLDELDAPAVEARWHRAAAVDANYATWELLDGRTAAADYTPAEVDDLLGRAYAASYHWARAAGATAANASRGAWLISRVHAVLGNGDLALHHADRCNTIVCEARLDDFDLGYAHEARARALACLGRVDEARTERERARSTIVADPEDRAIYEADLAAAPWFWLDR